MTRVALRTENDFLHKTLMGGVVHNTQSVREAITGSAVRIADKIDAKYIVSLTDTGSGARFISRSRGPRPILVVTPNEVTANQANLYFGCYPILTKRSKNFNTLVDETKPLLVKNKLAKKGDNIVIVSGVPFGKVKSSNVILVETI
jgi:pyruvate kinase